MVASGFSLTSEAAKEHARRIKSSRPRRMRAKVSKTTSVELNEVFAAPFLLFSLKILLQSFYRIFGLASTVLQDKVRGVRHMSFIYFVFQFTQQTLNQHYFKFCSTYSSFVDLPSLYYSHILKSIEEKQFLFCISVKHHLTEVAVNFFMHGFVFHSMQCAVDGYRKITMVH